jgi:glutamate-1-semialdehyde 2,1-aminomutase
LHKGIEAALKANNVVHTINRIGSMISVHFDATPVIDFKSAANGDDTFKILSRIVARRNLYCAIRL